MPVIEIRKYSNRRLYDTRASRYINLDELAAMVRGGEELKVVDAKTGDDLTREVMLQVIVEIEGGLDFLPIGLLRRVIRATGSAPGDRVVRDQLATAFRLLHDQMDRLESQFGGMFPGSWAPGPAPSRAAPEAPPPREPPPREGRRARAPEPPPREEPPPRGEPPDADPELAALRDRLAALESRLKRS